MICGLYELDYLMIVALRPVLLEQLVDQAGSIFGEEIDARDLSFLKFFLRKQHGTEQIDMSLEDLLALDVCASRTTLQMLELILHLTRSDFSGRLQCRIQLLQ